MQQYFGLLLTGLVASVVLFGNVNGAAFSSDSSDGQDTVIDFGTAIMQFTKTFKRAMQTGCPLMNLPVMDPLNVKYFPYNLTIGDHQANAIGNFSNVHVSGLSGFQFIGASYDNQTHHIAFDVIMPELQVLAEYMVDAWALIAGFPASSSGNGVINTKLDDYRWVGSVTLGTSPVNPYGLAVTELDIKLYLGDVHINNWNNLWNIALNNFANEWSREFLLMYVQQFDLKVDDLYAKYFIPNINEALQNISMEQLIQSIVTMSNNYSASNCALPKPTN